MTDKAGLESALEFTKFVITLDSGLMAFVTGTSFLADVNAVSEKVAVVIILLLLATSLVAGIFVYMRAATMFGETNYDLGDRHLSIPGKVNVAAFAVGAIGIGMLAIINIATSESPSTADKPSLKIEIR